MQSVLLARWDCLKRNLVRQLMTIYIKISWFTLGMGVQIYGCYKLLPNISRCAIHFSSNML